MEGVPDQTPVSVQLHEFAMRQLGVPAHLFYTRPDILVPGELASSAYGVDASITYDIYTIEAEGLGQEGGVQRGFRADGPQLPADSPPS